MYVILLLSSGHQSKRRLELDLSFMSSYQPSLSICSFLDEPEVSSFELTLIDGAKTRRGPSETKGLKVSLVDKLYVCTLALILIKQNKLISGTNRKKRKKKRKLATAEEWRQVENGKQAF